MIKKSLKIILFFLPVAVILIGANIYADPGNILFEPEKELVQIMSGGDAAYTKSHNCNERKAVNHRIEDIDEKFDRVAIGPSLIMTVNSQMVDNDSFHNFGVSGATYYDIIGILGGLDYHNRLPETVILSIDTIMFDDAYTAKVSEYSIFDDYINHFESKISDDSDEFDDSLNSTIGHKIKDKYIPFIKQKAYYIRNEYVPFIRINYFQSSVKYLLKNNFDVHPRAGIVADKSTFEGAFYSKDGSYTYPKEFRNSSDDVILDRQVIYINESLDKKITIDAEMSDEYTKGFEETIAYLKSKNVDVVFFLCPYPPVIWDYIEKSGDFPLLFQLEEYIMNYSKNEGIDIVGSYNPYDADVISSDFYDERHLKAEVLLDKFDFSIVNK